MQAYNPNNNQSQVLRVFQSKSETKAFYNKISKFYDLLADRSEAPVRNAGLEKLAPHAGEKILEIGFGTGHILVELAKAVGDKGKIYGIDLAEEMLERTEPLLKKKGLSKRVELTCGDAAKLPYPGNFMNAIFMSFTLELFDTAEIPKVLAECRRVLKPAGRIVVVGMSKEGDADLMVKAFEWTHRHFPNFLDCRPIFVRRSLEDAGFEISDASLTNMWIPVEIILAAKGEH